MKAYKWSSFQRQQVYTDSWRDYLATEDRKPTGWELLVEECYKEVLLEAGFTEEQILEEGIWSKLKYYTAKLGSLEKGGKIFGDRKMRHVMAVDKLEAAMEKAAGIEGNKFRKALAKEFPEFPNMEDKGQFLEALMSIGAIYDGLDVAVEKFKASNGKEGLDPDSANHLVAGLREYVKYIMDYKLADAYKHFKEGIEGLETDLLAAEQLLAEAPVVPQPAPAAPTRRSGQVGQPKSGKAGYAPEDPGTAKGVYTKAGREGEAVGSETMKGLESILAPLILSLAGLAGILGAILLKTPWAIQIFKTFQYGKGGGSGIAKGFKKIQTIIGPQPGEGFTQMFGRIATGNPGTFAPNVAPQQLFGVMQKLGIDPTNPTQLFQLGVDKAAYTQALQSGASTIGEMFPAANRELWLDKGSQAVAELSQAVSKDIGGKMGKGAITAATGQMAAASQLAATLGIGLVLSGAAVALIRQKGKKSSRAQMLNDLGKELVPFEGGITGDDDGDGDDDGSAKPECAPPRQLNKQGDCVCPNPDGTLPSSKGGSEGGTPGGGEGGTPGGDRAGTPEDATRYTRPSQRGASRRMGLREVDDDGFVDALMQWDEASKQCICKPVKCPDPENQIQSPSTCKCVPKPKPNDPQPAKTTKPGIAVLDDDTVSVFRIRWRKKDDVNKQVDVYKAAQAAPIIGRGTDPTSDQVADPSSETRPFKADQKTFAQIKRKARGRTGLEPFFAIDGSIIADLAKKSGKSDGAGLPRAGIGEAAAKSIVKSLFVWMLKNEKKAPEALALQHLKKRKVRDPGQLKRALAQLRAYGLVEPAAVRENKRPQGCTKCKKKQIITEAKQDEPWGSLKARWKELSGVK